MIFSQIGCVSGARKYEGETWVEWLVGVMCYGQHSASGCSVNEGLQVWSGKANYFRRYLSDSLVKKKKKKAPVEKTVYW